MHAGGRQERRLWAISRQLEQLEGWITQVKDCFPPLDVPLAWQMAGHQNASPHSHHKLCLENWDFASAPYGDRSQLQTLELAFGSGPTCSSQAASWAWGRRGRMCEGSQQCLPHPGHPPVLHCCERHPNNTAFLQVIK